MEDKEFIDKLVERAHVMTFIKHTPRTDSEGTVYTTSSVANMENLVKFIIGRVRAHDSYVRANLDETPRW